MTKNKLKPETAILNCASNCEMADVQMSTDDRIKTRVQEKDTGIICNF